jgi:hypothetical protein
LAVKYVESWPTPVVNKSMMGFVPHINGILATACLVTKACEHLMWVLVLLTTHHITDGTEMGSVGGGSPCFQGGINFVVVICSGGAEV